MSQKRFSQLSIIFLPVLISAGLFVIYRNNRGAYMRLTREDGIIEYVTAAFYFLGFFVGLYLVRKVLAKRDYLFTALYGCMTLAFLFIGFEEISWGQRILAVESGEFFKEANIQGEIGMHNLQGLHAVLNPAYILTGFTGAFAGILLPGLLGPDGKQVVTRLFPPPRFFFYFFLCFAFYLVAEFLCPFTTLMQTELITQIFKGRDLTPEGILALPAQVLDTLRAVVPFDLKPYQQDFSIWRHSEPAEMLLAIGFFLFALHRAKEE
jgi:hypothetical protein